MPLVGEARFGLERFRSRAAGPRSVDGNDGLLEVLRTEADRRIFESSSSLSLSSLDDEGRYSLAFPLFLGRGFVALERW